MYSINARSRNAFYLGKCLLERIPIPGRHGLTLHQGGNRIDILADDLTSKLERFHERGARTGKWIENHDSRSTERRSECVLGQIFVLGQRGYKEPAEDCPETLSPPLVRMGGRPVDLLAPRLSFRCRVDYASREAGLERCCIEHRRSIAQPAGRICQRPACTASLARITWLAARTSRVRLITNVASLPLRPPAMLPNS